MTHEESAVRKPDTRATQEGPPFFWAESARELMTINPASIRQEASVREAAALLTDLKFGAVPVVNKAGRPVGVLSRTDIVLHDAEQVDYLRPVETAAPRHGYQVEDTRYTEVREIMTPVIYAVDLDTPADVVIREMVEKKVHRLFVLDPYGVLIGVISAYDIVQHLHGAKA